MFVVCDYSVFCPNWKILLHKKYKSHKTIWQSMDHFSHPLYVENAGERLNIFWMIQARQMSREFLRPVRAPSAPRPRVPAPCPHWARGWAPVLPPGPPEPQQAGVRGHLPSHGQGRPGAPRHPRHQGLRVCLERALQSPVPGGTQSDQGHRQERGAQVSRTFWGSRQTCDND